MDEESKDEIAHNIPQIYLDVVALATLVYQNEGGELNKFTESLSHAEMRNVAIVLCKLLNRCFDDFVNVTGSDATFDDYLTYVSIWAQTGGADVDTGDD